MSSVPPYPLPNVDLIWRVAGHRSPEEFERSGRQSVHDIERALASVDARLSWFDRVLDFGCGCGRVLRWLDDLAAATELHGVDIDEEAIAWVRESLPFVQAHVGPHLPPLDFPDGHFDLIVNHSVFTHIDEAYQDAWLEELRRVAKPGGLVLLTVSGEHPFEGLESDWRRAGADPRRLRRRFEAEGIVYIEDDDWVGGPFPDFYHSTFHGPWYVFAHWRRWFEVRAYLVRGALDFQDLIVLRPRERAALQPLQDDGRSRRRPALLRRRRRSSGPTSA